MDTKNPFAAPGMPPELAGELPERLSRRLARRHYENFPVGSIFLPKSIRAHVYNVYAYCRVCDDLGDETGDPELSVRLLEWWREELHLCYQGEPRHWVFVALKRTIDACDLPMQPFDDLISAFLQDQRVTRYETFGELLGYCQRSANPVGRLFLHMFGYTDQQRRQLSDCTCTALQLANFWQDIPTDYLKGRIYIPAEDMDRFGYSEAELSAGIVSPSFRRLMEFEVDRTRELFRQGAGLVDTISGPGRSEVALFTGCGEAVLDAIERRGYNVFRGHIRVPKTRKLALVMQWALGSAISHLRGS